MSKTKIAIMLAAGAFTLSLGMAGQASASPSSSIQGVQANCHVSTSGGGDRGAWAMCTDVASRVAIRCTREDGSDWTTYFGPWVQPGNQSWVWCPDHHPTRINAGVDYPD